jgi:Flp pilus assembly protein TadG
MSQPLQISFALTAMLILTAVVTLLRRREPAVARIPRPQSPRGRSRRSGQRGAELVEMAFIVVPLFGLTFLLLDVSMVVYLRCTFQHAVREGVRYAITGQNTSGPCQDDSIKAVVKQNAAGFLNGDSGAASIHVHFLSPVNGAVTSNAYGNIVEVSVEGYSYGVLAPYAKSSGPLQITARAYDMMEAVPGALPCITKSE